MLGRGTVILIFLLGGCAMDAAVRDAAADRTAQAAFYLETIRTLQMPPATIAEAESRLEGAREAMAHGDYITADEMGRRSLEASERAIKTYYLKTVGGLAERARDRLARQYREDADRPVEAPLKKMEKIVGNASAVANDRQLIALGQVLDDLSRVLDTSDTIQWQWETVFQTDRIFTSGDELTARGREEVRAFLDQVAGELETVTEPERRRLVIRVVGYTDLLNFGEGTPLVKHLVRGAALAPPSDEPARRQFLNHLLSVFRGEAIARQVNAFFERNPPEMAFDIEVIGKGERLPPGVSPPYPVSDPRRRICKLYLAVEEVQP